MALLARNFRACMTAFQWEVGQRMIECSLVQVHDIRFTTLVLGMAFTTFLSTSMPVETPMPAKIRGNIPVIMATYT